MSYLGDVIKFLEGLGVYEVILPFLLIFTITFAILEKTRILGEVKIGEATYPNKNLDAVVAFVVALIMITATRLIAFINEFLSMVAVVMVIGIGFLLMIGVFYNTSDNRNLLESGWVKAFTIIIAISTVLIILYAAGVLDDVYNWIISNDYSQIIGTLVLLGILFGIVAYITKTPAGGENKE